MGIIGAGHVGGHVAMSLVIQGICRRVMLIDTDEKKARAQADDLMDGLCHLPWPVEIKAGSYEDLKDAQVVVMAACGAAIEEDRLADRAGQRFHRVWCGLGRCRHHPGHPAG